MSTQTITKEPKKATDLIEKKNKHRLNKRIKSAVVNGDFYLVHQLYKSSINRQLNQKDYEGCEKLLLEALTILVENQQFVSCTDLLTQLLELYEGKSIKLSSNTFETLCKFIKKFKTKSKEQTQIINNFIHLIYTDRDCFYLKLALHVFLKDLYEAENHYEEAEIHYISTFSESVIMDKYYNYVISTNNEYFFVRAALQLLVNEQYCLAIEFFDKAKNEGFLKSKFFPEKTNLKFTVYENKLTNFLALIIDLVKRENFNEDTKKLFIKAKEFYQEEIKSNYFEQLVDKIAHICFGIETKSNSSNNFLQNLISSIFSGVQAPSIPPENETLSKSTKDTIEDLD